MFRNSRANNWFDEYQRVSGVYFSKVTIFGPMFPEWASKMCWFLLSVTTWNNVTLVQ
jgi:hypothetical protein